MWTIPSQVNYLHHLQTRTLQLRPRGEAALRKDKQTKKKKQKSASKKKL